MNVPPVAVPTAFVTVTGPVVAPTGTVVVICVPELTVNVAARPLNFTDVAPVKLVPVITTVVPARPLVGVNDVIVGGPTVKSAVLVPVPVGVVTAIFPVVAPVGTVAVICVAELTVSVDWVVVLNFTLVAPQKFVPVIVTDVVPAVPAVGLNDVTVGTPAAVTSKLATLVTVPSVGSVTETVPSLAPQGTLVVIEVSFTTENVAAVPANLTDVATPPVLNCVPVPVIVTAVPGGPVTGKNVMLGAAHAGSADTSTPVTPSTTASAVARAVTFPLREPHRCPPSWIGAGADLRHIPTP